MVPRLKILTVLAFVRVTEVFAKPGAFTSCGTPLEALARCLASPRYADDMGCSPWPGVAVNVAFPDAILADPMITVPSRKSTVPVAGPPTDALTLALNVT